MMMVMPAYVISAFVFLIGTDVPLMFMTVMVGSVFVMTARVAVMFICGYM